MIISYDNDSLRFDMHIMMKMISRYYHSIITHISIKYQNINSQTNNILSRYFDKYMLFAGWEVRIVKNCDRGLENAAQGRRPRAAFSRPRSQFFTIRTDLCR